MKKLWIMIAVVTLCVSCFVGCGSGKETATKEESDGVQTQGSMNQTEEIQKNDIMSESTGGGDATGKNAAEATPEPMGEPVVEVIPEPTEEPSVIYEGIDMESDLPGEEWVETFVGIIDEPKIVVFSDETGRKEIFENDSVITFNPDTDMIGVYLPEGYVRLNKKKGITEVEYGYNFDYFYYCKLKPEETRANGKKLSAFYVEYAGEEVKLPFDFRPE